jgi:hypothetical protein
LNGFVYPYKYNILNTPPCGRLYGPEGTGRGLRPRLLKQPLDKVFLQEYYLNTCISTFSTFHFYLFHIFYGFYFKGPGEKSFWKGSLQEYFVDCILFFFQLFKFICSIYFMVFILRDLERNFWNGFVYPYKYNILNTPPCGRLYGPFGTGRGLRPRLLKQPLDKVFLQEYYLNTCILIFFNFSCFMVVFLERFSQ